MLQIIPSSTGSCHAEDVENGVAGLCFAYPLVLEKASLLGERFNTETPEKPASKTGDCTVQEAISHSGEQSPASSTMHCMAQPEGRVWAPNFHFQPTC